jgi:hypothetical protein
MTHVEAVLSEAIRAPWRGQGESFRSHPATATRRRPQMGPDRVGALVEIWGVELARPGAAGR